MPFNMFKAFGGSSRNRNHHRPDRAVYNENHEGFSDTEYHQSIPSSQLRRHETLTRKREEPVFTPVPSRAPTEGDEYYDGYVRVDNPQTVLGGALNARPTRPESPLSPVPSVERDDDDSRYSETFSEQGPTHSPSMLPDRPPSFRNHHMRGGADLFNHGNVSGRRMPVDGPVVTHISRSDGSGSNHTVEAPLTPVSSHSNARVTSLHPTGSYRGKSPTDIYTDGGREIRPMRREETYLPNRPLHPGSRGPIYYIIPGGVSVIFQDEYGNEVARVGDFSGRPAPRPAPFVVQDTYGRELYSYDGFDHERPHSEPRVVLIDTNQQSSRRPSSSRSYHNDPSYRYHDDYYHEDRGRNYRDNDHSDYYRDRDHRDREYRARDHQNRHNRDRSYRGRDDWPPEDRSRGSHPSMHSHSSSSRHERQLSHSHSDDRQSNSIRLRDRSHPSDMHQVEIIDGIQSLQI